MANNDYHFSFTLQELTISLGISKEVVISIIDEAIIPSQEGTVEQWQFDDESIRRIRTVLQLNRDLGINIAGAGLVLELLEEIERLQLSGKSL